MALLFANNATSRLRIDTPAGSTTVTVAPGDGAKFPNPTAPDFFTLTLEDRRSGQIEIMSCTARSGDILTVTRGQEGTTAQDFVVGATAANRLTAASLATLQDLADAYTKAQADAKFVDVAGDTMTGPLALPAGAPTLGPQATNKTYVDAQVATKANVAHTHPESDVINLVADLAARPTEAPNDGNPYARRNVAWIATITKVAYDIDIAQIRTDINTNASNIAANTTVNNTQNTRLNALETTIATKEDKSAKGAVSGYAPLDSSGKVPSANLPPIAAPGTYVPQTGATGAGNLPVGNSGQRPTAAQGLIRFNTDTLTFEGNNGTIWSGIGGGVTVGLTAPTPAKQGDLWWKSDVGLMYIYYDDGNTQQWVVATPNQDISGLDSRYWQQTQQPSFRNRLINGNFEVYQRGGVALGSATGNRYFADRWLHSGAGTTYSVTAAVFNLGQVPAPPEGAAAISVTVASVAGAANYCMLLQAIEGVRSLAGQQVTLSWWAWSDASRPIAVSLLQNFGTGGSPSASVSTHVTKVTVGTTWTKYTATVTVPSIAGKTGGTAGNDFLQLAFWFDAGSNYNTDTNNLGQQSGTFGIAQVQLEAGAATPFERRLIGAEYELCERYYQVATFAASLGTMWSSGFVMANISYRTLMRALPVKAFTISSSQNVSTTPIMQIDTTVGSTFLFNGLAVNSAGSWIMGTVALSAEYF